MLKKQTVLICVLMTFCSITPAIAAEPLKSVNVNVQPLGFLLGLANAGVQFGISDTIALGPSFTYSSASVTSPSTRSSSLETTSMSVYGFGVSGDFFLNHKRFTDGILLTLGLDYALATVKSVSASGIAGQAEFGYGWFWNSGFNIMLQGGIAYQSVQVSDYSASGVKPAIGFRLGWAF